MNTALAIALLSLCAVLTHAQTLQESQRDFIQVKAPEKLTWENFDQVATHASQDEQERRYHQVHWENSVLDAQRKAFLADKPIVMILFFGDHRVNC